MTPNKSNSRLYEENISSQGQKIKIIRYRTSYDMDVQFEDGTIVYHKSYQNFKKGYIKNPNININTKLNKTKHERLNQTSTTKDGTIMTCIEYFNANNITVQFPDGSIRKNITWGSFIKGEVAKTEDKRNAKNKESRINQTSTKKDGTVMTCIEYFNSTNITVQFPDGSIRKNIPWRSFITGDVAKIYKKHTKNKKSRVNQTSTKKDGTIITCIEYFDANNITVQFPDGSIRKNVTWTEFVKGSIAKTPHIRNINNKRPRINQTSTKKDGTVMTCIEYFNASNITVQFPDGSIRRNVSWNNFIKGEIAAPDEIKDTNHINETKTARNGLKMTIIKTNPGENPTIQFEDGYITQDSPYRSFQRGCVTHNTLKAYNSLTGCVKGTLYNTTISGIAHNYRNTTHYFCKCQICKKREI